VLTARKGLDSLLLGFAQFAGLIHPFVVALCYTASIDESGSVSLYGIFNVPARVMPWILVAYPFLSGSLHGTVSAFTGIVAAHMFEFIAGIWPRYGNGPQLFRTPKFIQRIFSGAASNVIHREYGTAYRPGTAAAASGAHVPGVPDGWRNRGTGHRLG
jgi:Derlin-2/3